MWILRDFLWQSAKMYILEAYMGIIFIRYRHQKIPHNTQLWGVAFNKQYLIFLAVILDIIRGLIDRYLKMSAELLDKKSYLTT